MAFCIPRLDIEQDEIDRFQVVIAQLQVEGGYLVSDEQKALLHRALWDDEGHRTSNTIARPAAAIAETAGFELPEGKTFLIVKESQIGKAHRFSSEKLSPVLGIFRYSRFEQALEMVRAIYEVGGKGHSCGIYSFDDDHIHRLALTAPVSRIMVRQPQSKANAGAFNNGMPMTSSLGCGTWGGNIVSENVHLKHYMNTTWVSVPIKIDQPSDDELFGDFYDPALEMEAAEGEAMVA